MAKQKVNQIASGAIIFRGKSPDQIFLEIKDDGHPIRLVRRQLCLIGGNWIGEPAKSDKGPLDTFRREWEEELSFERPLRTSLELSLLGQADIEVYAPPPAPLQLVSEEDKKQLDEIKAVVCERCAPFGVFTNTIPKAALDAADPGNKRDGFAVSICYWAVSLSEAEWRVLEDLQDRFGNLSNESITLATSLDEIVASGAKTAFGHDQVLQRFFLAMGLNGAKALPMVEGIESVPAGTAPASYEDYLELYDVAKKP